MIRKPSRNETRKKRHARVRRKISGTPERPRLNVFRSSKHIYAQLIDDVNGVTVASASSLEFKKDNAEMTKTEAAKQVGELVAKRAIEKGYQKVVFDRGGYLYHGRVAALAEGAREQGLQF